MNKNYRLIEFHAGQNIESAIKEMQSHTDLVCGKFNNQTLYSDIDDMDSAFKKVTGETKAEFDEAERIRNQEYNERKRKHTESIPKLTQEWIKKGNAILDEKHHRRWAEIVPIRLGDIYEGMELKCCLEIVKPLNKGESIESVKPIIDAQGHSGMSFGLVCSMVKSFCDRGEEFVNYVK